MIAKQRFPWQRALKSSQTEIPQRKPSSESVPRFVKSLNLSMGAVRLIRLGKEHKIIPTWYFGVYFGKGAGSVQWRTWLGKWGANSPNARKNFSVTPSAPQNWPFRRFASILLRGDESPFRPQSLVVGGDVPLASPHIRPWVHYSRYSHQFFYSLLAVSITDLHYLGIPNSPFVD